MACRVECACLVTCVEKGVRFIPQAAIAVRGDLIEWAGEQKHCPAEFMTPEYSPLDAGKEVVVPGLVNCHGHSSLNVLRGVSDAGDFPQWARELSPHTSRLGRRELESGNVLSVLEMLASGTTCICDCTRFGTGMLAAAARSLGMRAVVGGLCNSAAYRKDGNENFPQVLQDMEEAQKRWKNEPLIRFHIGAHSPYNCTPELIRRVHGVAKEKDMPFIIHAAESPAEEKTIRDRYGTSPVRWLDSLGVLTERTVLVHCIWIDDEEIRLLALRGCKVVHCPVSNAKLRSGAAPVRRMKDAGITVALGTDSMLSNNSLDLFGEIKTASLVDRLFSGGEPLSCEELFAMATLDGARTLGMEREIGSLAPGKKADLVFLNLFHPSEYDAKRLLSDLVFYAGARHVSRVMVGGEMVFAGGRYFLADAERLRREMLDYFKERAENA